MHLHLSRSPSKKHNNIGHAVKAPLYMSMHAYYAAAMCANSGSRTQTINEVEFIRHGAMSRNENDTSLLTLSTIWCAYIRAATQWFCLAKMVGHKWYHTCMYAKQTALLAAYTLLRLADFCAVGYGDAHGCSLNVGERTSSSGSLGLENLQLHPGMSCKQASSAVPPAHAWSK
jgi:hypothetical protein